LDVIFFKTVTALAASAAPTSQPTSLQYDPKRCKQSSFSDFLCLYENRSKLPMLLV